jgi:hypothetical protein
LRSNQSLNLTGAKKRAAKLAQSLNGLAYDKEWLDIL